MTLIILYIGTAISAIYLLSCLGLLVGTLRNRSELMLPWLLLDSVGAILVLAVMVAAANSESNNVLYYSGGEIQYWIFCFVMTVFNVIIWTIVFIFYKNLRQIAKLRQMAGVAIPLPGSVNERQNPYQNYTTTTTKENNMYLATSDSVKHYVSNEQSRLM